jgi:hypothetical protein
MTGGGQCSPIGGTAGPPSRTSATSSAGGVLHPRVLDPHLRGLRRPAQRLVGPLRSAVRDRITSHIRENTDQVPTGRSSGRTVKPTSRRSRPTPTAALSAALAVRFRPTSRHWSPPTGRQPWPTTPAPTGTPTATGGPDGTRFAGLPAYRSHWSTADARTRTRTSATASRSASTGCTTDTLREAHLVIFRGQETGIERPQPLLVGGGARITT